MILGASEVFSSKQNKTNFIYNILIWIMHLKSWIKDVKDCMVILESKTPQLSMVCSLPGQPLTFQVHLEEKHHLQDLVYPDLETISTNCLHTVPQILPSKLFQTTFLLIKKKEIDFSTSSSLVFVKTYYSNPFIQTQG